MAFGKSVANWAVFLTMFAIAPGLAFATSSKSQKPYVLEKPCGHFVCDISGFENSGQTPRPLQKKGFTPERILCAKQQLQNVIDALKKSVAIEKDFGPRAHIQVDLSLYRNLDDYDQAGEPAYKNWLGGQYSGSSYAPRTINVGKGHIYVRTLMTTADQRCLPVTASKIEEELKYFDNTIHHRTVLDQAMESLNRTIRQFSMPPLNATRVSDAKTKNIPSAPVVSDWTEKDPRPLSSSGGADVDPNYPDR